MAISRGGGRLSLAEKNVRLRLESLRQQRSEYEVNLYMTQERRARIVQAIQDNRITAMAYRTAKFSPIQWLPKEILLLIFEHACAAVDTIKFPIQPEDDDHYFTPYLLASICKYWRDLSIASSILWVRLSRNTTPCLYSFRLGFFPRLPLLTLQERAFSTGPTSLRVCLAGNNSHPQEGSFAHNSVDLNDPAFSAVRSLSIYNDGSYRVSQNLPRDFHHLQINHIAIRKSEYWSMFKVNRKHVRTLWLQAYPFLHSIQAACLHFDYVPEMVFQDCGFMLKAGGSQSAPICYAQSVELSECDNAHALFEAFAFPNLKSFALTNASRSHTNSREICLPPDALENMCPQLEKLRLEDVVMTDAVLLDILRCAKGLKRLSIIDARELYPYRPTLTEFLLVELQEGLCPHLESIELVFNPDYGVDVELLMEMLEGRAWAGSLRAVVIGFRDGVEMEARAIARLRALRSTGVTASLW
ncbi:hypothetical protein CYLTODRAFT_426146 [Cylindrobasidium torrendii FP15055 ss-10]|uniref:F-box domain-containing protein n=1 Tax=Cylindrobasidium torrendii FP15055 ss-10 TaxID=1314674 RepID=A0A0D7AYT4_9AGAR|nr:hypothetical protein CYLTODRAFT_426146 [Cylindrobasidium torrendii FP15055 ss-10]